MADDGQINGLFNLKASFPTEEEKNAFFTAARKNDISTLEKTLKKFPDAAQAWRNRFGAAAIAACGDALQPKTLSFLLKNGAAIEDQGPPERRVASALQAAAQKGIAAVVETLLRGGAKVDGADAYGRTPLMFAAEEGHLECADLLVLAGADPGVKSASGYRNSALDNCKTQAIRDVITAAQARRAEFLAGTSPAVKPAFVPPPPPAGMDVDAFLPLRTAFPTPEDQAAFFTSAKENEVRALRRMFEKFPDAALKWRDRNGQAVIAHAGAKIKAGTLELLLANGADINDIGVSQSRASSALHAAATAGDIEWAALLLRFGAKIDQAGGYYGQTPLMCAITADKKACVDLLVLAGADPTVKDTSYHASSALDTCRSDEMREIIKAAQEKRAYFIKGLPPEERPRFVPPRPPAVEISTVKILKRIDLRFKI